MELDAFSSRLGLSQGRILARHDPELGDDVVFVLGSDEPGRFFELTEGDIAEVVQSTDLTGVDLIRSSARFHVPEGVSPGFEWEVAIVVDDEKLSRARCRSGYVRTLGDMAANVSKLNGLHIVGVRLELVATP